MQDSNTTWPHGKPTPIHKHLLDQLSVTVEPGVVKVLNPDGSSSEGKAVPGTVRFLRAGTIHQEEGTSAEVRRAFMFELKGIPAQVAVPLSENDILPTRGTQSLNNDGVQVWDVLYPADQRALARISCCDSVAVYLAGVPSEQSPVVRFPAGVPIELPSDGSSGRVVVVVLK